MSTTQCQGWCDTQHRGEGRIEKDSVKKLFRGTWPAADGFNWDQIDHFHVNGPGTMQGFDGGGEPIGPTIEYEIKVLTPEEAIAMMQG
jgi:hypothetical protein